MSILSLLLEEGLVCRLVPASGDSLHADAAQCAQLRDLTTGFHPKPPIDNSAREQLFRIERSRDGLSYGEIATVPANLTRFSDRSLKRNTRYFYRVRSQHAEGLSGYTNYSFATILR